MAIIDLAALERRGLDKAEVLLADIMGLPTEALEPHRHLLYARANEIASASMPRMGELRTMFERWSASERPELEPSAIACLCVPVAMGAPDSGVLPLNCTAGETLLHALRNVTAKVDQQFTAKHEQQMVRGAEGGNGVTTEAKVAAGTAPSPLCDIDYDALLANAAWVDFFEKEAARLLASITPGAAGEVQCPPCEDAAVEMMRNAPLESFHGRMGWASALCLSGRL